MRVCILYASLLLILCCGFAAGVVRAQELPAADGRGRSEQGGRAESASDAGKTNGATPEKLSAAYYYNRANYAISREM